MSISWKFKQTLNPFTNAQGYPEAVVISGNMQNGNSDGIKQILFSASGEMYYTYSNDSGSKIYDSRELNGYLRGSAYVDYPFDYVVVGTYQENRDVFTDSEGTVIPARTNAIYCDETGKGVYRFTGIYNNLLGDSRNYSTTSINDKLFVVLSEDFSQDTQDIVNILNTVTTKLNTYFLRYQNEVNANKYILTLENYYQYSHYCVQDDNEKEITLLDNFDSMGENAKAWLLSSVEFDTDDIYFATYDSFGSVADAIREQVGDSEDVKYYFPDTDGIENTFIKKIKKLNNTHITDGNPVKPEEVILNKEYWLDGELKKGTMPNWGTDGLDWGGHAITSVGQIVKVPKGYHDGVHSTVQIWPNDQSKIISENIKNGITVLGVSGKRSVIETNPNDDSSWTYGKVPATADRIVTGYSAYLDGAIIDGSLTRYDATSGMKDVNYIMYPSAAENGTVIELTDGEEINTNNSCVWGQTTNDQSQQGILTAYPAETKYAMSFAGVANRNIVSQYKLNANNERVREDGKLSDNLHLFPNNAYILGYKGTMPSYYGDVDIDSNSDKFSVEADSLRLYYNIKDSGYFNKNSALYASYSTIRTAYNNFNADEKKKIIADNIKSGSTIFGINGSSTVVDVRNASTIPSNWVLAGNKFYDNNGILKTGTMTDYYDKTQYVALSSYVSASGSGNNGYIYYAAPKSGRYVQSSSKIGTSYSNIVSAYNNTVEQGNTLSPQNIRIGATVMGVAGSYSPSPYIRCVNNATESEDFTAYLRFNNGDPSEIVNGIIECKPNDSIDVFIHRKANSKNVQVIISFNGKTEVDTSVGETLEVFYNFTLTRYTVITISQNDISSNTVEARVDIQESLLSDTSATTATIRDVSNQKQFYSSECALVSGELADGRAERMTLSLQGKYAATFIDNTTATEPQNSITVIPTASLIVGGQNVIDDEESGVDIDSHSLARAIGIIGNTQGETSSTKITFGSTILGIKGKGGITDLTGTTWKLNSSINTSSVDRFGISFESGTETFDTFDVFDSDENALTYLNTQLYESVLAYNKTTSSWLDQKYRTIFIISGPDVNSSSLISWLQNNAQLL